MTDEGCERNEKKRTHILDDLRNKRRGELKEETEDRKRWKLQFITQT